MAKYIITYKATKRQAIEADSYSEAQWEAQRLLDTAQISFSDSDSLDVSDVIEL